MRMWMINPRFMCKDHLLGEHKELHMFVGTILKGKNLGKYVQYGLVEVHSIKKRHAQLVEEMLRRGWQHNTPISPSFKPFHLGTVDSNKSNRDLFGRCWACRKLLNTS